MLIIIGMASDYAGMAKPKFICTDNRSAPALSSRPKSLLMIDESGRRRPHLRSSSTPSTSWRSMARTCAACRCRCARPILLGCWRARPDSVFVAPFWIKVKNRKHPAMSRVMEVFG